MKKLHVFSKNILLHIVRISEHGLFLNFIILFFILEAAWVAISFRFPMLFDEHYHVGVIDYFAHHVSPIALHQAPSYDQYGNMAFSNASLYHYFMSFPYRIIVHLTNSFEIQIIFLRLLNVIMAACGLWLFAKVFQEIGIKKHFINLSLFFFSIIPLFIFVSATISYDNLLLPLAAYFFLVGVRIVQSEESLNIQDHLKLIIVGLFASLVKFTFLPIFVVGVLYVIFCHLRRSDYSLRHLAKSLHWIHSAKNYLLAAIAIVLFCLFSFRYVYPIAIYHTPLPECSQIISKERCLKNGVYYAVEQAITTKNERDAKPLQSYAEWWVGSMVSQFDISAANTGDRIEFGKRLPVTNYLLTAGVYLGVVVLIFMWRILEKTAGWSFLIFMSMTLVVTLFLFNAAAYYSANTDLNTQTRYALTVLPIVFVMALVAINQLLGRHIILKTVILVSVIAACSQGMGDIKHVLTSNESWYWPNSAVTTKVNEYVRNILEPLVKE